MWINKGRQGMIVRFDRCYEEEWDRFVLEKSINGCFLQTRNF